MSDAGEDIGEDQPPLKKVQRYIPGFRGYLQKDDVRDANRMLRMQLSQKISVARKNLEGAKASIEEKGLIVDASQIESALNSLKRMSSEIGYADPTAIIEALTHFKGDPPLDLGTMADARLLADLETSALFFVRNGYATLSGEWATTGTRSAKLVLRGSGATATLSLPPRSRDLRNATRLELDVFNPAGIDHADQWFLHLTAIDRRGHWVAQRFLLRPDGVTHLSLPVRRAGFDRRHVIAIVLSTQPAGSHTILVDSLSAR